MRLPADKNSRGFTLIELMVSLTILAALLAVTYSGFRVALTIWEKSNDRAQTFERRQTVLRVLREQVQAALPVRYFVDGAYRFAFEGQPDRLRFVSQMSWKDGTNAVPRWIELRWDDRLFIDERQVLPPMNTIGDPPIWHLELDNFEIFRFSFLRRTVGDRPAEWQATWEMAKQGEFPAAVAIEGKAGGEPFSLVVPLDYAEASWKGYQLQ